MPQVNELSVLYTESSELETGAADLSLPAYPELGLPGDTKNAGRRRLVSCRNTGEVQ